MLTIDHTNANNVSPFLSVFDDVVSVQIPKSIIFTSEHYLEVQIGYQSSTVYITSDLKKWKARISKHSDRKVGLLARIMNGRQAIAKYELTQIGEFDNLDELKSFLDKANTDPAVREELDLPSSLDKARTFEDLMRIFDYESELEQLPS